LPISSSPRRNLARQFGQRVMMAMSDFLKRD
jgi:hypothetical protein